MRKQWWRFLLAAGFAAALVRWRLTPRRWAWLTHRRNEEARTAAERPTQPRPGDILLFHHVARLRDLLITMVTHSPFYHTALYAGEGHVIEARPQGVIYNDLRGRERNFVVSRPRRAREKRRWRGRNHGSGRSSTEAILR